MSLGDKFKLQKKGDSRVWTVVEHDPATGAVTGKGDEGVTFTREEFCIPVLTPNGVILASV